MSITERLKKIIHDPSVANDGSKELAQSWLEHVEDAKHLEALKANPAFCNILNGLKTEFKDKMLTAVRKDAELNALRQVFIRLVGLDQAEDNISSYIDGIMESDS